MSEVNAQGPLRAALEKLFRDRLVARLIAEGNSKEEVEATVQSVGSAHPLLDLFMQYGLPFILQLIQNLLDLNKPKPPVG